MGRRDQEVIYVVDGPPPAAWWRRRWFWMVWLPILVFVVLFFFAEDPGATGSGSALEMTTPTLSSGPAVATEDPVAIQAAAERALNRLQELATAKDVECSSLSGRGYDACVSEYDEISEAWDTLFDCLDGVATISAVRACESEAGVN